MTTIFDDVDDDVLYIYLLLLIFEVWAMAVHQTFFSECALK